MFVSGNDGTHHLTLNIREAEVAAGITISEALMINAHEVEDRGVKVVGADGILYRREAELVGAAMHRAALDAATGHPDTESVSSSMPRCLRSLSSAAIG